MTSLIYPPFDHHVEYSKLNLEYDLRHGVETLTKLIIDKETIIAIHQDQQASRISDGNTRLDYLDFCCNLKRNYVKNSLSDMLLNFNKINSSSSQRLYAFITVGWNEQIITPQKMLIASQNILKLKYFKTAYMVLEKHRENGEHHHTHYLVEFGEKFPISKIIGWIHQTRQVKELCLNKNFIDYLGPQNGKKPFQSYEKYFEYIHGNKKNEKLKYCADDKKWRVEHGILDIYKKSDN